MRTPLLITLACLSCILACSCTTTAPGKREVFVETRCVIETDKPNVLVEVYLDGGLVFSGKTAKNGELILAGITLSISPGAHTLAVTANGYNGWERDIAVVDGTSIWAALEKRPVRVRP